MAADKVTEPSENVITIRKGRGGYRPGAGRPPATGKAAEFRAARRKSYCVYVMHETGSADVCKVGLAKDPYMRLADLQTGTWRRLSLSAVFEVADKPTAEVVEKFAHTLLRGLHESGEWFRVTPDKAREAVVAAGESLGVDVKPFSL